MLRPLFLCLSVALATGANADVTILAANRTVDADFDPDAPSSSDALGGIFNQSLLGSGVSGDAASSQDSSIQDTSIDGLLDSSVTALAVDTLVDASSTCDLSFEVDVDTEFLLDVVLTSEFIRNSISGGALTRAAGAHFELQGEGVSVSQRVLRLGDDSGIAQESLLDVSGVFLAGRVYTLSARSIGGIATLCTPCGGSLGYNHTVDFDLQFLPEPRQDLMTILGALALAVLRSQCRCTRPRRAATPAS